LLKTPPTKGALVPAADMCYRWRTPASRRVAGGRAGQLRARQSKLVAKQENVSMAAEAVDPRRPDNVDVEVGRLVRVQRISRGLSQTELGNEIGVTFQQVQKYESGANRISMGRLTRIGRVLGVDVTYLLGASRRATPVATNPKEQAKFSEAVGMLGRIGALRLLKAFSAIPNKPPALRESIVQMVEGAAAASKREAARKKTRRH
jgi:transcriptional regulator with XRE-family HTH domain